MESVDALSTRSNAGSPGSPGEFVDMSTEIREPWASAMVQAGLVDPRNGRPSMSRLAEAAESHPSTISAMIAGRRRTSTDLLDRVAVALKMADQREEVYAWAGVAKENGTSFRPHPDADLLTDPERRIVNELIRVMTLGRRQAQPEVMPFAQALEAVKLAGPPAVLPPDFARRVELVTDSGPEGQLILWDVKVSTSSQAWSKGRHNRVAESMRLRQELERAMGRSVRLIVVHLELPGHQPLSNRAHDDAVAQLHQSAMSGPSPQAVFAEAARTVGRAGSVAQSRRDQDQAGEPPSDDAGDMEPR